MKKRMLCTLGIVLAVVVVGLIAYCLFKTSVPLEERTIEQINSEKMSTSIKETLKGKGEAVTNEIVNQKTRGEEGLEKNTSEATLGEEDTTKINNNSFEIKLNFVGDLLCATDERTYYENCFEDVAKVKKPSYFLKKVRKYFLNDDYTIGDAENVYSNKKLSITDKGQIANPNIEAYWFKTKKKNARILKAGGIDYVSIDNNHILDYGPEGRQDTKSALEKYGINWGNSKHLRYYEKNGFRIGIIAESMYNDGALAQIKKSIKEASKNSDYQIVYFHGGTEAIHEPEEWKVNACKKMIDYGADLVIGDHPHVLQPMEKYKGATIIYSMGNFVFGGNRHPENRTIIYGHTLTVENKKVTKQKGKIIPCYVYTGATNNWQPAVIKDKATKKHVIKFMHGKVKSPL